MRFEVVAPNGCGIRSDKRLKKVVIRADNVQDEKDLYALMGRIQIYNTATNADSAGQNVPAPERQK